MAEDREKVVIQFDTNADKASKDIDKLTTSLNVTESTAANLNATFDEVYGGLKPLTARMGEAEDRLYELALAGKTASQEYKDLLAIVGNYRKTQIETDKVVDAAATTLGQKLGGAAQIAATGVQGVTAGMALFGDQSEDTEKALLKVQSAMAFADAISNVSTLGGQFTVLKATVLENSLVTKANAAATAVASTVQKLFTGSVNTTTTSFKVLKGAVAALGIGLLIIAVSELVQNFSKIKSAVLEAIPGLAGAAETIGNIVNAVTDFVGVTSEADRAIERIKSNADQSISLNKKFLAEHGSQLNEFTKQKISAKDKYNEAVKEDGADITALGRELNRELAKIEYSRGDEQRAIQKTNSEKAAADAKTAKEKADKKVITDEEDAIAKREVARAAREKKAIEDFQEEQNIVGDLKKITDEKQKGDEEKTLQQGTDNLAQLQFFADEKKKIGQAETDQKKKNSEDINSIGESLLTGVKMLAGKNKALQRAAVIAEGALSLGRVGVNIATGVSKDAASGAVASIPQIIKTIATGAISTASIISNTAKSLQAIGGGGSGGAGSSITSLGTGAASAAPQTGFQPSATNQLATSISANTNAQPIIKAYVVAQDVTDQQKKDTDLVSQNSFGGVIP
tara:strand:- start:28 stop:1908 length:1881 start_codon:yes stop_codon:yes gene_type:complete